ncbi:MAG: 5'-3' exonuclease H3TH domain-containing protein [Candidatus Polarisedimenticolia bacterium]
MGPSLIPDLLALVGDPQDGYPGITGIGRATAARLLNRYGPIERFPPDVLGENRTLAIRFKDLATLRVGRFPPEHLTPQRHAPVFRGTPDEPAPKVPVPQAFDARMR